MNQYPVFLPCRDRLTPLLALISWLERVGQNEIYLLDNDSSFPPLLEFYRETKYPVLFLKENLGPRVPWKPGLMEGFGVTGRFIVSDPDVVPIEDCPDDAIDVLSDILDRFPDRVKAGFGILIDDLPDHYPRKSEVLAWERQYWQEEVAPGLYDAFIDTTFALYRPGVPWSYGPSVRTGPPYLIRHTPWYADPAHLSAEEAFYQERADRRITHWGLPTSTAEAPPDECQVRGVEGTNEVELTIGMATYNDFDGVYFTLQALRLYQDLEDTELLVVDNYGCDHTQQFVEGWVKGRYVRATEAVGTAAPRDLVFREASGEAVLCCDSHVLFAPDAIRRLKAYYREHPDTNDLMQGPLVYDDLQHNMATHFDPNWRAQMWGTWATDPRGEDPEGEPFEIPMQGLGAFSCRKAAWPGFNPAFRGFGGEEGYIHEKFRQAGGRCLCLPWLRWVHRFGRPAGVPYPLFIEDKLRNYIIGHAELGLDLAPVVEHFSEHLLEEKVAGIVAEALGEGISAPPQQGHGSITVARDPAALTASEEAPLPLVSCICPTYNRSPDHQHLLEEAIESFLRQTYPHKELIVLNDCPGQELVCDAPGVRVINVPERFRTLGEKYNAAVALARGELIAPWEDDDISLPWRLALSVDRLGNAGYFNPQRYWFRQSGLLHSDHPMGIGHNASLFTRAAFDTVRGYAAISGPQDGEMDAALRSSVECVGGDAGGYEALPRSAWYYIYRWGVSPAHLSGSGSPEAFYAEVGQQPVRQGRFLLRPHWRIDYEAAVAAAQNTENGAAITPAAPGPVSISVAPDQSPSPRRAIVCFVEDKPHLIQQLHALRLSWLYAESPDTDLVVMGPEAVLAGLPDDLVKIAQQPAADDPVWRGYRYINPVAALNGAGAEQLDRYSHLLRTDLDTFITPAWNTFSPTAFTFGPSGYANDEEVRQRIRDIAADYGLTHRGMTNIHTTWYGPTAVVRRAAAFTELLTKHLLTHHFCCDDGAWPGWYRGVAVRYAGEIAVNHCAPEAQRSELLDVSSTSRESTRRSPHIHCWHTDETFSKHAFMSGRYTDEDAQDLDMTIIRDHCLALSLRSLQELALVR